MRPATEAGSAEQQPARDTGVTDCDGRRGGPHPACRAAAFSQPPARDCIGVVPCLRKPWGEATAGSRGVKPPSSNSTAAGRLAGGLPAVDPARPSAPPPSARSRACRAVVTACRHPPPWTHHRLPLPAAPPEVPFSGASRLTSNTEAVHTSLRDVPRRADKTHFALIPRVTSRRDGSRTSSRALLVCHRQGAGSGGACARPSPDAGRAAPSASARPRS